MSAMKKREKSLAKSEAILKGAMDEFLIHGFIETTMDDVAHAAGVSKATVYAHFEDKEHLFEAFVQHLAQQKLAPMFTRIEEVLSDKPPAEVLSTVLTTLLSELGGDFKTISFIRLLITEAARFPTIADVFMRAFDQPIVEWLTAYLASHSELCLVDPEAIALILFAIVHQQMLTRYLLGNREARAMPSERLIVALVDLITARAPMTGTLRQAEESDLESKKGKIVFLEGNS